MSAYLKVAVFSCKLLGFWPHKFQNTAASFIYNCYFGLTMMISLIMLTFLFMEVPNAKQRGLKDFSEVLGVGFQFSVGLIKSWCCLIPSTKRLILKIQVTENKIFENGSEAVKKKFEKKVKKISTANKIMVTMVLMIDFLFSITPLLAAQTGEELLMPLTSWTPLDKQNHYGVLYVWQILGGMTNSLYVACSDTVYFCLVTFVTTQLELLQIEIKQGIDMKKFSDLEVQKNLRNVIIYHNNIVRFAEELNQIVKPLMLLAYVICVVHVAVVSFEIATESFSFLLVKNICYLVAILIEQYLFYSLANEMYTENLNVFDAMWNSDWYNCSSKVKKNFLLMMMMVQKPLRLSVGSFFYMSLETMIMVWKSSLSYAVALVKLYDIKN